MQEHTRLAVIIDKTAVKRHDNRELMDHEGGIIEAWATGVSLEGKVLVEGNAFSARHDDGPADKGADDFENLAIV